MFVWWRNYYDPVLIGEKKCIFCTLAWEILHRAFLNPSLIFRREIRYESLTPELLEIAYMEL